MMDRCLECNGTLKADESACFMCGSARKPKIQKPSMVVRCATVVKVLFILSGVLTVASLFFSVTPSFLKCLATTIILMFVNRSADAMAEKQRT
jgi:hypothetical protein